MSKYHAVKTQFKDRDSLVEALQEIKCGTGEIQVEVHDTAQQLFDFQNRPTYYVNKNGDKANVIVRRQYVVGASNDIGFVQGADGTYSALISEYDSRRHGSEWVKNLTKSYTEKAGLKRAKKLGFKVLKKETVGKKIQYQLVRG